jgi:hypothetical protein
MFVFDNALDKDARSYGYELYEANQVSGSYPNINPITSATIYSSGTSGANVFTVAVENSTDSTTTRYYGRIRTIDSSGNPSEWSPIVQSDQANPLISNQYISSITAAKITAGTIGAHEIVLTQAGSPTSYTAPANTAVIRSSNYQANTAGWLIRGDGYAEFDSTTIRGGLKAGSVFINSDNRWKSDANGNLIVNPEFKVGSSTKYLSYDGANTITFTGNLVAAGGTFSGNLSAAGGSFSGQLDVGSGNTSFHVDTAGNMWLGNASYASAPFRVSNAGAMTATSGTFSGAITGSTIDIGSGSTSFHVNTLGQIWSGNAAYASAPFRVDNSGSLFSTSGTIGGNNITATYLETGFGLGSSRFGDTGSRTNVGAGPYSGIIAEATAANYSYLHGDEIATKNSSGVGFWLRNMGMSTNLSTAMTYQVGNTVDTYHECAIFFREGGNRFYLMENNQSATLVSITPGAYSDRRLKDNIRSVSQQQLDKFYSIKVHEWDWNANSTEEYQQIGIGVGPIADELKELYPHIILDEFPDLGYTQVEYIRILPQMICVVQDLNARIKELEARLAALE